MRVKMLVETSWATKHLFPKDVVEVDDEVGERWVKRGLAIPSKEDIADVDARVPEKSKSRILKSTDLEKKDNEGNPEDSKPVVVTFQCNDCDFKARSLNGLRSHVRSKHPKKMISKSDEAED